MKVKNVLLTGAGGKIGRAVLPELVKAGYCVRALEANDGLRAPRLENVEVVLADYLADRMNLPVVKFEVSECHDFCIDMSKSRSVLGLNPEYDIFRIADDALQFRAAGRTRSPCPYPG